MLGCGPSNPNFRSALAALAFCVWPEIDHLDRLARSPSSPTRNGASPGSTHKHRYPAACVSQGTVVHSCHPPLLPASRSVYTALGVIDCAMLLSPSRSDQSINERQGWPPRNCKLKYLPRQSLPDLWASFPRQQQDWDTPIWLDRHASATLSGSLQQTSTSHFVQSAVILFKSKAPGTPKISKACSHRAIALRRQGLAP